MLLEEHRTEKLAKVKADEQDAPLEQGGIR